MAIDPFATENYRSAWARFALPGFPPTDFHIVGPGALGVPREAVWISKRILRLLAHAVR